MVDGCVRRVAVPAILAVFIVVMVFSMWGLQGLWSDGGQVWTPQIKKFASVQELRAYLMEAQKHSLPQYGGFQPPASLNQMGIAVTQTVTQALAEQGGYRFSETNVQVSGVDEEDIVKTDGKYIYIAQGSRIFIVRAYPPSIAGLQAVVNISEAVTGLYVNGDSLVAVSGGGFYGVPAIECLGCIGRPVVSGNTTIQVFDISDRSRPVEVRRASVTGWPIASRMIGDYVYLITSEMVFITPENVSLPRYSVDGVGYVVEPTMIYYANIPDQAYTYTNILSVNVKNHAEESRVTTVMTPASGTVYVSHDNIYITAPRWVEGADTTAIHRLAIDGPEVRPEAAGE
ncbi:MAG: beta-propeller domain-containing protein, partial [Nitrososphaerota archaeon]